MSAELFSSLAADSTVLLAALIAGWILPALSMRMLIPTLASGRLVTNYRGRSIPAGLGLVWPIWAALVMLAGQLVAFVGLPAAGRGTFGVSLQIQAGRVLAAPMVLVLGAFALGFADDTFGTSAEKGFRGHLRALRRRRLTTGGLKLVGIGLFAAAAVSPAMPSAQGRAAWVGTAGVWVLQVLAIALTANFVNLLDLRPGRALKGYVVLVVPAVVLIAARWYGIARGDTAAFVDAATLALSTLAILLGPVAAVWRFDLGEHAMLGDAGANPAGALAGFVVAAVLPVRALFVYVALVLVANVASERVSFSDVIERTPVLRWADRLGRIPEDGGSRLGAEDASPGVNEDG